MTATQQARARFQLACLWRLKGKPEAALAALRNALELDPGLLPAWIELIDLLRHVGQEAEARQTTQEALGWHPSEPALQPFQETELLGETDQQLAPPEREHVVMISDCPGLYGAGAIQHALLCDWRRLGYRVTCIQRPLNDPYLAERERLGIPHQLLEADDLYTGTPPLAMNDGPEFRQILGSLSPDLIVFNDGCPFSSLAAKEAALSLKIPCLALVHAVGSIWARSFEPYLRRLGQVYGQLQAVVAVSHENLRLLEEHFGLPVGRGQVIWNGRPERFFAPPNPEVRARLRAELGIGDQECMSLTVASLEPRKGYQYQLAALRRLQETVGLGGLRLVWVGQGHWANQLRAGTLDLPVQLLGERRDIPDLLEACDCFVLPSEFEGMPLAVLEAMARARPVLATAVSGIPEALDGLVPLLPDPSLDPQATVVALADNWGQWAADASLRQRLGRSLQDRAQQCFRQERMLEEYRALLSTLLSKAQQEKDLQFDNFPRH